MAHFAKISEEKEVITVLVINNEDVQNEQGEEVESIGQNFCQKTYNWPANLWIQCSYNTKQGVHQLGGTPFRGNYAGIGYSYDAENDVFLPPKPFDSWVKTDDNCNWKAPVDEPTTTLEEHQAGKRYVWNEDTTSWDVIQP